MRLDEVLRKSCINGNARWNVWVNLWVEKSLFLNYEEMLAIYILLQQTLICCCSLSCSLFSSCSLVVLPVRLCCLPICLLVATWI